MPVLRGLGFSGSYPHFRRVQESHVDLLMFSFGKYGGAVACEISYVDFAKTNLIDPKLAQNRPLVVTQTCERFRLGSMPEYGKLDHWFIYDPTSPKRQTTPIEIAERLKELVRTQGMQWWSEKKIKANQSTHRNADMASAASAKSGARRG